MRPCLASPDGWTKWYADQIRALSPGLTEILGHPRYDDLDQEVRQAFRAVDAVPVTWEQVGTLLTFSHSTRPPSQWLSAETVSG